MPTPYRLANCRHNALALLLGLILLSHGMPGHAATPGDRLLRQAFQTLHDAPTMTAQIVIDMTFPSGELWKYRGTVAAKKPNLLRVDIHMISPNPTARIYEVADGRHDYALVNNNQEYQESPLAQHPLEFGGMWKEEIDAFFGGEISARRYTATYTGTAQVGSMLCEVVTAQKDKEVFTYFIGKQDHHIYRMSFWHSGHVKQTDTLFHLRCGVPLAATAFRFQLPSDAHFLASESGPEDALLSPGAVAPEFALPALSQKRFTLTEARRGKKAFLINFWFTTCGPCRAEFPVLQRLYAELGGKGLGFVAVNYGEKAPVVQKFVTENRLTFPVALGRTNEAVFRQYGVSSYPVSYLLDADGKIVWRAVGFTPAATEPDLRAALKKLGVE